MERKKDVCKQHESIQVHDVILWKASRQGGYISRLYMALHMHS